MMHNYECQHSGHYFKTQMASKRKIQDVASAEKKGKKKKVGKVYSENDLATVLRSFQKCRQTISRSKLEEVAMKLKKICNNAEVSPSEFIEFAKKWCDPLLSLKEIEQLWSAQPPCKTPHLVANLLKVLGELEANPFPEGLHNQANPKPRQWTDKELRDVFLDLAKTIVKISNNGDIWVFDEEDLLWKSLENDEMRTVVMDIFAKWFPTSGESKNMKLKVQIETEATCNSIWKLSKKHLTDKKIDGKFNFSETALSLADNNQIEFSTLHVRKRQMGDYWTKSTNVAFLLDEMRRDAIVNKIDKILSTNTIGSEECESELDALFSREFPEGGRFLASIMHSAAERNYLRRKAGYCLTGLTSDRKAFCNIGIGMNGKSVFNGLMQDILGDFAETVENSVLMKCRKATAGATSNHILQVKGLRYAILQETDQGERLSPALFKKMISSAGDRISARGNYKQNENFINKAKFDISSQYVPYFEANTAMRSRLRVIPWDTRFYTEDPKRNETEIKLIKFEHGKCVGSKQDSKFLQEVQPEGKKTHLIDCEHEKCIGASNCLFGSEKKNESLIVHRKQDPKFVQELKTNHINQVFTMFSVSAYEVLQVFKRTEGHLPVPKRIEELSKKIFDEMDPILRFIKEWCEEVPTAYQHMKSRAGERREKGHSGDLLFSAFTKWRELSKNKPWRKETFLRELNREYGIAETEDEEKEFPLRVKETWIIRHDLMNQKSY